MRKKISLLVLTMISAGMLTGCGKSLEISEESSDVIVDYMASTVMKHQVGNTNKFKYYAEVSEEEKKEETKEENTDNKSESEMNNKDDSAQDSKEDNSDNKSEEQDLIDTSDRICGVMGIEGCSIKLDSFKEIEAYIEDESYEIRPENGKKLYKLEFTITNSTKNDIKLDLIKRTDIKFELKIEENSFLPLFTVAENDIITLSTVIKPSGNQKIVAFYQVDKDITVETAYFKVTSDDDTAQMKVK